MEAPGTTTRRRCSAQGLRRGRGGLIGAAGAAPASMVTPCSAPMTAVLGLAGPARRGAARWINTVEKEQLHEMTSWMCWMVTDFAGTGRYQATMVAAAVGEEREDHGREEGIQRERANGSTKVQASALPHLIHARANHRPPRTRPKCEKTKIPSTGARYFLRWHKIFASPRAPRATQPKHIATVTEQGGPHAGNPTRQRNTLKTAE